MEYKFKLADHVFIKYEVIEYKPHTITNKCADKRYNAIYQLDYKDNIWFKEKDLVLIGNKYNLNNLSKSDLEILDYCLFMKSREVNFIPKKLFIKVHNLWKLAINEGGKKYD